MADPDVAVRRPRLERFLWQQMQVELYLIPRLWMRTKRLEKFMLSLPKEAFWTAPELKDCLQQPFPGAQLAAFLLAQQPFREILVLLLDEKESGKIWVEDFLSACYPDRNGLYLVGADKAADRDFFDWLYEQSGLLTCVLQQVPDTAGIKTAFIECRRGALPPVDRMQTGSLYLDLTSEFSKQRFLQEKRTDISYISARNYLDTAFKARYNAF